MSVAELKGVLHESIENINDEDLLFVLKEIIDEQYRVKQGLILSTERRQALELSEKDAKEGRFVSNEESDRQVNAWLKK